MVYFFSAVVNLLSSVNHSSQTFRKSSFTKQNLTEQ